MDEQLRFRKDESADACESLGERLAHVVAVALALAEKEEILNHLLQIEPLLGNERKGLWRRRKQQQENGMSVGEDRR